MHAIRWTALAVAAATAVGLTTGKREPASRRCNPACAPSHAYRAHDYADGQAMSILPPGENGLVNATDAGRSSRPTGKRPANSEDQLGKYANLLYGYTDLTDSKLAQLLRRRVVRREAGRRHPHRDARGRRHDLPRPARRPAHLRRHRRRRWPSAPGYAQAEDRLFLMDVLRHYGEGTLASFLGASCEFEQMDHDQLLLSPYTAGPGAVRRSTPCRRSTARRARWPRR